MGKYIKNLPQDAKRINGTMNWVDRKGNMYGIETRILRSNRWTSGFEAKHKHYGEYFKYNLFVNNHNGYVYGSVKYILPNGKKENRQRRIHILVAETFIPNPNNYPIVGHKNNIKSDNRVENLYWTTYAENTQKAVDDGLLTNDKGYDDSQSHPVYMFNTYTNELMGSFGSCREASRETGVKLNTIMRQAKYKHPVRKPYYFRFQDDPCCEPPEEQHIVVQYDLLTGQPMTMFYNSGEASRQTGINQKVITQQCRNGVVPKWTKSGWYFSYK